MTKPKDLESILLAQYKKRAQHSIERLDAASLKRLIARYRASILLLGDTPETVKNLLIRQTVEACFDIKPIEEMDGTHTTFIMEALPGCFDPSE